MDIEITQKESAGAERHLAVTIPAQAVQAVEERTARRYVSQARLPGFRPGKAPAAMVRKRFASEIRQDTLQELVQEAYQKIMAEQPMDPVTQPHIHDLRFEQGEPVSFTFHFEVRPEITLERVEGFDVGAPSGHRRDGAAAARRDARAGAVAPLGGAPAAGDR
jgi:trigger factor